MRKLIWTIGVLASPLRGAWIVYIVTRSSKKQQGILQREAASLKRKKTTYRSRSIRALNLENLAVLLYLIQVKLGTVSKISKFHNGEKSGNLPPNRLPLQYARSQTNA